MPPGRGNFDFKQLFNIMDSANFNGSAIIELYSLGYNVSEELKESKKFFSELWQR
jgi:sugar phosphate isomerase/epimerase